VFSPHDAAGVRVNLNAEAMCHPAAMLRRTLAAALATAAVLLAAPAPGAGAQAVANPVIPGDHPDPSVVRAGGVFYATATAGPWAPLFPVFRSTDLVTWRQIGAIFPRAPSWTGGTFWAPELVRWSGRFVALYSAKRGTGRPCIGVATAAAARGPWRDRGPALCVPGGVIDAAPFTDERGARWLLFKRLGAGNGISIIRFSERRMRAVGTATELLRPTLPWEGGVTEGPSLVRRDGRYVLFYAGGHCCGPPCSYAEGVAYADHLLGPYVKDTRNPLLRAGGPWKCPGHGTLVDLGARGTFLLHHAQPALDPLFRRRPALLSPVTFGPDGAVTIGEAGVPPAIAPEPLPLAGSPEPPSWRDAFTGGALHPGWEWLFDEEPDHRVAGGRLRLRCRDDGRGPAFVARQVVVDGFVARARLEAMPPGNRAGAGLAAHGPGRLMRGVELRGGVLRAFRATGSQVRLGPPVPAPAGRRTDLVIAVGPDGSLALYGVPPAGEPVRVPPGPAAGGPAPTRAALTCRGEGEAAFGGISVRAAPGPAT
jgi:xylan 1,4-beta-xylosidase